MAKGAVDYIQKSLSTETGKETIYVWNEFLTSKIHNQLKNSLWTVQLAYGFFKQIKLSIAEMDFMLTLIARRSRHFAGTRVVLPMMLKQNKLYLKMLGKAVLCK